MSNQPPAHDDRTLPGQAGVLPARPELGGGVATPSFHLPAGAGSGIASAPRPTVIAGRRIEWGRRTLVMGIVNVTPDSFSGDGLLGAAGSGTGAGMSPGNSSGAGAGSAGAPDSGAMDSGAFVRRAVEQARRMVADGADLLDVGGESTRPGHERVDQEEELRRVVPVIRAIHAALPETPISVDTTRPAVAAAALDAGAAILNDVWGVAEDDSLARLAAERGVPIVVMHNRAEARYSNVIVEVIAELGAAVERAVRAGVRPGSIIIDPGFGFGKTPEQNIAVLRQIGSFRLLGCPILLGTSRKSTLGRILDLPADQRLEATLATTALAIAAGVDIVRVHDVRENVRVARIADAIVRGWSPDEARDQAAGEARDQAADGADDQAAGLASGGAR